jgi:hypothetical protein
MLTHASSSCVINAFLTLGNELLALGDLRLTRFRQDVLVILQFHQPLLVEALTCFNVAPASNLIKAGFKLYRPEKPWSFVDALYLRKRI